MFCRRCEQDQGRNLSVRPRFDAVYRGEEPLIEQVNSMSDRSKRSHAGIHAACVQAASDVPESVC